MQPRYALYYTPPPGSLAEALAHWLGWDPACGVARPHPHFDLPRPLPALTERPRRYGPHGTLKPPFHLAERQDVAALGQAVQGYAAARPPVPLGRLDIARIGRFLALVPAGGSEALARRAAEIVRHFDRFRAPPDAAEHDRRRQARLSPRQTRNLDRWGYPHVMEDFRFHVTLTGPLKPDELPAVEAAAREHLAGHLPAALTLDALSLLRSDPATGRFHLIARHAFSGG